jgi:choline dehydrogenase-like flavoprotein
MITVACLQLTSQQNARNNGGVWSSLNSIDPETGNRVTSASAYLAPNLSRSNLTVITGAYATRIVLKSNGTDQVAESVEYAKDGQTHTIGVNNEVILSAGTLLSWFILVCKFEPRCRCLSDPSTAGAIWHGESESFGKVRYPGKG